MFLQKRHFILPSNQSPLGTLPARFRRERLLIVGCGDVGVRVARGLGGRVRLLALTSQSARAPELRALHITPLQGNLDQPFSLRRLAGLATRVVHLAPPPNDGADWWRDPRTQVDECRTTNPHTPRAHRRVDAESTVRHFGRAAHVRASILRIPGIYAPDRAGGTPRERLLKSTPVLDAADDVYTNHIHADDLARACLAALWRGKPQRVVNASDDSDLKMGDYMDLAADLYGLPRPPRIARDAAADQLPLSLLSFMGESRRLVNRRLKRELKLVLHYPTVATGLLLK